MRLARKAGGVAGRRALGVSLDANRAGALMTDAAGAGVRPWRPNLDVVAGARRRCGLAWLSGVVVDAAPASAVSSSQRAGHDSAAKLMLRDPRRPMALHDELMLRDREGREHLLQLDELQVAARRGDEITVVWTTSRDAERGPFIVVRNHTSADTYYDEEALLRLYLREPRGVFWTALLIATCFTPLVLGVPWILIQRAKARRAVARFKDSLGFVYD